MIQKPEALFLLRPKVLGIGDVELEVKTSLSRKGSKSHRTLVLKDVLYVPSLFCNILGGPILKDYGLALDDVSGLKDLNTGACVALFDKVKLWKLWLVGHQKGQTSLDMNEEYWIIAWWPKSERARWENYQQTMANGNLSKDDGSGPSPHKKRKVDDSTAVQPGSNGLNIVKDTGNGASEYTESEKTWLKNSYGGEFRFLQTQGLSIHKEEDREEGRAIARAMMEDD